MAEAKKVRGALVDLLSRPPTCPYCGRQAALVAGNILYPHRPDLRASKFYQCAPCDAYVGCHPVTSTALGRLANAELRQAKVAAHAAFDPLWNTGSRRRSVAYAWLAWHLGLNQVDCHIGMLDVEQCEQVVEVCCLKTELERLPA